jgi:hypothetical protein
MLRFGPGGKYADLASGCRSGTGRAWSTWVSTRITVLDANPRCLITQSVNSARYRDRPAGDSLGQNRLRAE